MAFRFVLSARSEIAWQAAQTVLGLTTTRDKVSKNSKAARSTHGGLASLGAVEPRLCKPRPTNKHLNPIVQLQCDVHHGKPIFVSAITFFAQTEEKGDRPGWET